MKTVELRYEKEHGFGFEQFQGQTLKKLVASAANRKLYFFGAGKACVEFLREYGDKIHPVAIIENNINKIGTNLDGVDVISIDQVEDDKTNTVILITTTRFEAEIYEQLKTNGFPIIFSVYSIMSREQYGFPRKIHYFLFAPRTGVFSKRNIFYNYVVFSVLAVLRTIRFYPAYHPYKGIEKYKNKHKGERCFIIATGPSLTLDDINLIKSHNEITFGMNSIYKLYDKTDWRPDYYAIQDPKFLRQWDMNSADHDMDLMCKETAFLPHFYYESCKHFKKVQFYPISYLDHLMRIDAKDLKYSFSFLWGIYCAYTVTNMCIQMADYMGFSEIYLIGTDCNYSGEVKHFTKESDEHIYTNKHAAFVHDNLMRGYTFIGENVKKRGTKIYNATRGGMLEVFERVKLEDVLSDKEGVTQ